MDKFILEATSCIYIDPSLLSMTNSCPPMMLSHYERVVHSTEYIRLPAGRLRLNGLADNHLITDYISTSHLTLQSHDPRLSFHGLGFGIWDPRYVAHASHE